MGLLKTALIGGIAYKMGSKSSKNDEKHSSSNSSPPPPQHYYYPQAGYPPQQMYGQPPYGAPPPPQSRPPYDPAYIYPAYGSYGPNGGYPPQQSSRGIQDAPMSFDGSSASAPPPYQSSPAYQSFQNRDEKSPVYSQGHQYQPSRQN